GACELQSDRTVRRVRLRQRLSGREILARFKDRRHLRRHVKHAVANDSQTHHRKMTASRIDIFKQMLATDPGNTMVMFGLAKEYEKAGRDEELIETLNRYLEAAEDEGNAFGMLAG